MGSFSISLTSLEHLVFRIDYRVCSNYYRSIENLRDADVWSHIDSITTRPAGSRLQRVEIMIDFWGWKDSIDRELRELGELDDNQVLKAVLDGLPSLRMKSILFVIICVGEDKKTSYGY